jgi:hypothetical protein
MSDGGIVLVQTYEPVTELGGQDGVLPCDAALARELIRQHRAEIIDPKAEAFRYCPGSRAYEAMRASRGKAGPVLVEDEAPVVKQPDEQPKPLPQRRPRKTVTR